MKHLVFILVQALSMYSFCQEKTTTLILQVDDCRTEQKSKLTQSNRIQIFHLPADTLFKDLKTGKIRDSIILITNVPIGNYRFKYMTHYQREQEKIVTLEDQPINQVQICPDLLDKYPRNTLAKLKENETLTIDYKSNGCYHFYKSRLIITKVSGKAIAQYYLITSRLHRIVNKRSFQDIDSLVATSALTERNLYDFVRFENELLQLKEGFCTIQDSYEIRSKYWKTKQLDFTCSWTGFTHLVRSIFPELK